MKILTKLSLLAVTIVALSGANSYAGDPTTRWQKELERQRQADRDFQMNSVAVYSGGGMGDRMDNRTQGSHYESRQTAHGKTRGVFVPDRR